MKYYLDTEFIEGPQTKSIFRIKYGETKPTIDLMSVGIVAEDNRQYYAVSKDFKAKEAWNRYDEKDNTQSVGYRLGVESSTAKWLAEFIEQL